MMPLAALAFAETGAHLEDSGVTRRQQAFHVEFWRRPQETGPRRFGVNVLFQCGSGDPDGRLDLGKPFVLEPGTKGVERGGPPAEHRLQRLQPGIFEIR
jgi:hypothetical protein